MKNLLPALFLISISLQIAVPAFSQFYPMTNSSVKETSKMVSPHATDVPTVRFSSATGVPCSDSGFWAISAGDINLFTIIEGEINHVSTTILGGSNDMNLAYCNNLNGGSYNPTFYTTQAYNTPAYYNGTSIVSTSVSSPFPLYNPGGYGDYLYYMTFPTIYSSKATAIQRFDGTSFTTIYTYPGPVFESVFDLAVDANGNVWFITGADNNLSDTIHVISPTGQVLREYPFTYHTENAFGLFLIFNKLYIGLGAANPDHPFTVVPVSISDTAATPGTPLPMPVTTIFGDMASCFPGTPLAVNDLKDQPSQRIYPNPFSEILTFTCKTDEPREIFIYDVSSREVMHKTFTGSVTLGTRMLSKGVYLYSVRSKSGETISGKLMKD
jgi:hypothetical protein